MNENGSHRSKAPMAYRGANGHGDGSASDSGGVRAIAGKSPLRRRPDSRASGQSDRDRPGQVRICGTENRRNASEHRNTVRFPASGGGGSWRPGSLPIRRSSADDLEERRYGGIDRPVTAASRSESAVHRNPGQRRVSFSSGNGCRARRIGAARSRSGRLRSYRERSSGDGAGARASDRGDAGPWIHGTALWPLSSRRAIGAQSERKGQRGDALRRGGRLGGTEGLAETRGDRDVGSSTGSRLRDFTGKTAPGVDHRWRRPPRAPALR